MTKPKTAAEKAMAKAEKAKLKASKVNVSEEQIVEQSAETRFITNAGRSKRIKGISM